MPELLEDSPGLPFLTALDVTLVSFSVRIVLDVPEHHPC